MTQNLFDVSNKIVILTGGLGQLGQQFSAAMLDRGARVAVFDNRGEDSLARPLEFHAPDTHFMICRVDVTRRGTLEAGLERVISTWGSVDALINNAALDSPPDAPATENGPFESYPESSWDRVMSVNVKGVFLCCQVVGKQMALQGHGSIVNISSIYGLVSPDQRIYEYRHSRGDVFFKPAAYSVSKSALLNLTRYLATYYANQNVRVNTLTLGGVANAQDPDFLKGYCARVPLGRMARADEYNGAMLFLISEASSYMTGANLVLDGGWTAW